MDTSQWCNRHLIMKMGILVNAKDCDDSCEVLDGQTINVSKMGNVNMLLRVDGEQRQVTFSNVYYMEHLVHKFLSCCELERKVVVFSYTVDNRPKACKRWTNSMRSREGK